MTRSDALKKMRAAWLFLMGQAQESGYGFMRTDNPHDFFPDPEGSTESEIAAHRAACDAYDRGEYEAIREPSTLRFGSREEADAYVSERFTSDAVSASIREEGGEFFVHVTAAPWGIGGYTMRWPEPQGHADALKEVIDFLAEAEGLSTPEGE